MKKGKGMDSNDMCDYERGEYDCLHGHDVKDNESPDYYSGYGDRYCEEQNETAKTVQQFNGE